MRIAALQLCSGDDPAGNVEPVRAAVRDAAGQGARTIFTPEVTNCVSLSRSRQREVLKGEADDPVLAMLLAEARDLGVWIHAGSLALTGGGERFLNRGFVLSPEGRITARYDKMHMFDVAITPEETFRESDAFAPGDTAVVTDFAGARLGLSICYDLRFAHLYRRLAKAGADILAVPAAFSPETGRAHWEVLLRARAIETGSYVVAAAQSGTHPATEGRARRTWGHSMVVSPWGEVIAQMDEGTGPLIAEIDLAQVRSARTRVPSLRHDRAFGVTS